MYCVAIGDVLIGQDDFRQGLMGTSFCSHLETRGFHEGMDRHEMRAMIRKMEVTGPDYERLDDETIQLIQDKAELLFVHLAPVNQALIEGCRHLKAIISCRGGLENIDVQACQEREIALIHCPHHNANAVAEYTIGLILSETRNIGRSTIALHQGQWREHYPNSGQIRELRSLTVGIIGYGTIGRLVHEYLKPFHAKVLIYDPYQGYDDLEVLLRQSDVISLHSRIEPGQPPVIGQSQLAKMKPTAVLINTARAMSVDYEALYQALAQHQIGSAALDVYPEEPLDSHHPLCSLDNCTLTNHRAGDTLDSYVKTPELAAQAVEEWLLTKKTRYLV